MEKNTDKCHSKDKSSETHIGESIVKSSGYEKVLDIEIYSKIHFW